jgi:hypothetical protein
MIAVSLVDGEESSQYLIERSMMRPRFLLNLLSHCRGYAINLGHDKIQPDDIRRGLDAFSTDLIYDIDLEIRDVLPDLDSRTGFRHREWQKYWRLIQPGKNCGAKLFQR